MYAFNARREPVWVLDKLSLIHIENKAAAELQL